MGQIICQFIVLIFFIGISFVFVDGHLQSNPFSKWERIFFFVHLVFWISLFFVFKYVGAFPF